MLLSSVAGAQGTGRSVERWLASAERAAERGRIEQAWELWRRAAARAPEDGRAAARMVEALPSSPTAVADCPAALRALAADAERAIARHLETADDDARASQRARRLGAWATAVAGDHARAIDLVAGAAGLQDAEAAGLLRRLAAVGILRADLRAAQRALEAAHRALPQESDILAELGAIELALGNPSRAIDHFARVLGRRPDDLGARRDLAGALVAAGRAHEAVALLALASEAHPGEPDLLIELALAALEAGQPRVAEQFARSALAEIPEDDGRAHSALGAALAAQRRAREAEAVFAEAIRRDPGDLRARQGLDALRAVDSAGSAERPAAP